MKNLEKILVGTLFALVAILIVAIPLIVSRQFFFPFIFPKAVGFRLVVEISLVLYLILSVVSPTYRPRLSPVVSLYGIFVLTSILTSLLGANFYLSFWGDMERSEGLLMHLHLLAFLFILTNIVRTPKHWRYLLQGSLVAGLIMSGYALGQRFGWEWAINTQGIRLSSTIGNPAFFATALLFNIFFALFLLATSRKRWQQVGYGAMIALFVYLTYTTATRGALLGLVVAIIASGFFITKTGRFPRARFIYGGVLVFLVAFGIFLQSQANTPWLQKYEGLNRLATTSLDNSTVRTRLMTWNIALKGFADSPFIGNGLENFNLVFNQYFDPRFFEDEGSVVWFDRAHSIFFERLVTGGIIGVVTYFGIFVYVFTLLRRLWRTEEMRTVSWVFSLLFVAYIFQNLFVFDSVISYMLLMVALGFVSQFDHEGVKFMRPQQYSKSVSTVLLAVYGIFVLPIVYFSVIQPAQANNFIAKSLFAQARAQQLSAFDAIPEISHGVEYIRDALELNTYGNPEFRVQYAQFIDTLLANNAIEDERIVNALVTDVNLELQKHIEEDPKNVATYLLAMRHYNFAHEVNEDFPRRSITLFDRAVPLSPERLHVYFEAGYAHVYRAQYYESLGELELAAKQYELAAQRMQKTIDLRPEVPEPYVNLMLVYFSSNKPDKIKEILSLMDQHGVDYHNRRLLRRLSSLAVGYESYEYANQFLQEQVELDPNDIQSLIDLALSYAYIGEEDLAIQVAEQVRSLFPANAANVDGFIQQVKDGVFRQ